MVAASPPDFSVDEGGFFFLGQGKRRDRGGGVFRSGGGFFDEVLGER